jgi:serine/threonine protein kinase
VRADGPVDPARAVEIVQGVANALDAAHEAGLVHRDVKPSNVLLESDGAGVFLADFGLARQVDGGTLTAGGAGLGTLAYAAPEQLGGATVGRPADIYALAGLFWFLLMGRGPYAADDGAAVIAGHLSAPIPRLEGDLSVFNAALERGLAKGPDERWPSAGEFAAAVASARTRAI